MELGLDLGTGALREEGGSLMETGSSASSEKRKE